MCSFNDFVSDNSGFILTFFGLVSACLGSIGVCFLRSRCTTIRCCGIVCERSVLSEEALREMPQRSQIDTHLAIIDP